MANRLDYAEWDPIPGVSRAPFDHEDNPTWKLLLHTTEGGSYVSARSAYHRNGFSPHVTAGVHQQDSDRVSAWQNVGFNERATTLGEDPGGIVVNRDYVIQIEMIGYADRTVAQRNGHSHLYIHNWADWYIEGLAKVCNDILDEVGIPRQCTVEWVEYPASYGKNASQRLTTAEYDAYEGILGHQHAPENSHGDPGNLGWFVDNYLLEKDMPLSNDDKTWLRSTIREGVRGELERKITTKGPPETRVATEDGGRYAVLALREAQQVRARQDVLLNAIRNMPGVDEEALAAAIERLDAEAVAGRLEVVVRDEGETES